MKDYVVSYDVSCAKLRAAIFQVLSRCGVQQQKSVFLCQLNAAQKQALQQQLGALYPDQARCIVLIEIDLHHPNNLWLGAAKPISAMYLG